MSRHFSFVGRSERIVITILLLLIGTGLSLQLIATSDEPRQETPGASHRADTLYRSKDYVGPPEHLQRSRVRKFAERRVLDLNTVDSLTLLRVPGIGPAFARRILTLRQRLGGYYTVLQLQEVYGMDADKYLELREWFRIGRLPTQYPLAELSATNIPRHPYLSYQQRRTLAQLIRRHGTISRWSTLMREPVFSRDDSIRLCHYFPERLDSLGRASKR